MTSIHVTNHSGPYRTIQDHTEPYQTTEGPLRGNKRAESQKEPCICHSLTDSEYFTHIEKPTQLKRKFGKIFLTSVVTIYNKHA